MQALADAIRRVTDMNPDLSVEKIEIQSTTETRQHWDREAYTLTVSYYCEIFITSPQYHLTVAVNISIGQRQWKAILTEFHVSKLLFWTCLV